MNYDREEKGIRICLNEEELPFNGYFIGSKNYYRRIDDINPKKGKNGFGLMGVFEDKRSTILFDGVLYLAVCREQDEKTLHFLFTVENKEFKLIKCSKAQKGAIRLMWNNIAEFIAQKPKVTLQELFNAIDSLGADLRTLEEFSIALHSYAMGYEFDANYRLPSKENKDNK
ncbi:MAG: hypothetical protein J6A15_00620 [Clostridia bacterium]|nr:hypothetical protein [Clostridia bacterium]